MADAKKIRQDLTALEAATEQLSDELNEAYRAYLSVLAQSLRSQLVSACYGLCTQSYPERFLKLTFDQREQMQQAIQSAIAEACAQLDDPQTLLRAMKQRRLQSARNRSEDAANHDAQTSEDTVVLKPRAPAQSGLDLNLTIRAARVQGAAALKDEDGEPREEGGDGADIPDAAEPGAAGAEATGPAIEAQELEDPTIGMPDIEARDIEAQANAQENAQENVQASGHPGAEQPDREHSDIEAQIIEPQFPEAQGAPLEEQPAEPAARRLPRDIVARQKRLEAAIAEALEHLTDEINDRLREAGILPQPLPEAMLEAVIKAGSAEVVEGPPNVFSLMMHTDEEEAKAAPIMAIRLQVSELEFNDTRLSTKRSQLRNLHGQLRSLSRKYEKRQREWTTIEAESAWRAAWYEPSKQN